MRRRRKLYNKLFMKFFFFPPHFTVFVCSLLSAVCTFRFHFSLPWTRAIIMKIMVTFECSLFLILLVRSPTTIFLGSSNRKTFSWIIACDLWKRSELFICKDKSSEEERRKRINTFIVKMKNCRGEKNLWIFLFVNGRKSFVRFLNLLSC